MARALTFLATFAAVFAASLIGNQYWASNPLEQWIQRRRQEAFDRFARDNDIQEVIGRFDIDWNAGVVRLRELH